MRFFNTAGPVNCEMHYCLDPLHRFDLDEVLTLIGQQKYFVLHAPRQTGKTSSLLALKDYLNREGRYRCLYINVEVGQFAREDAVLAMRAILGELASQAARTLNDSYPQSIAQEILAQAGPGAALNQVLALWAKHNPQPLVLLIDEIDSLVGNTLIAVLRQLRAGYTQRPGAFPQSVVLCGVRDVRDYRMRSADGKDVITGGSAFNIKAVSLRLGNFTESDVAELYQQHTAETGQLFAPGVMEQVWDLTDGQPWLVNALAYEVTFNIRANRDRTRIITPEQILEAKENLILRRETHLDQLVDKLKEPRVQRVISPMLRGATLTDVVSQEDLQYVTDLGLIRRGAHGPQIANAIYREVIPRELTFITQLNFESLFQGAWYIDAGGRLAMDRLLAAFQQFFREHSESWVERFDYKEAGPQLLLQAFLQRIVNGGGRVEREYGLGRKRTDLLVIWLTQSEELRVKSEVPGSAIRHSPFVQRIVIELKVLHKSLEATLAEGLAQTWDYMDKCGAEEGHLVIFDRTPGKLWEEKLFRREEVYQGRAIIVWGM